MNPLVSVIIPYNEDRGFLQFAIESVKNQTYGDVECLPVFGDRTAGANFNEGLKIASGDFVMVLAEDDWLLKNAVADLVAGMNGYDFVCANAVLFGSINAEYKSQVPRNHRVLAEHNSIHGGTVMYRRDMLLKVGGMNETLWTAEEYELNMRLLKLGYKLGYVDSFVQMNRVSDLSKSRIKDPVKKGERIMYIERIKSWYK